MQGAMDTETLWVQPLHLAFVGEKSRAKKSWQWNCFICHLASELCCSIIPNVESSDGNVLYITYSLSAGILVLAELKNFL